ncbi:MAG: hypothetical protein GMKNLPBB_01477 [Myxococcota bacterium]|nr:hypothetical protein [Myxococcota bacterium]
MSSLIDWERTRARALRAAHAMAVGAALTSWSCGGFEHAPADPINTSHSDGGAAADAKTAGMDAGAAADSSVSQPVRDASTPDGALADAALADTAADTGPSDTGAADAAAGDAQTADRGATDVMAAACGKVFDRVCPEGCTVQNDADCCVQSPGMENGCGDMQKAVWRDNSCQPEFWCGEGPFVPPAMA